MKQLLMTNARHLFAAANLFPTAMTERSELRALLQSLYPVSCSRKLVRLGPNGDGGYLVPNDLVGIEACFSPGVSDISGFEKECANSGIRVFLADKSVEGPAETDELFCFTRKYVGVTSDDDYMTLDSWVEASLPGSHSDLLLQIDIEGYEYEVFLSTSETLMRRFRIIVAEFHLLDQLWSKPFFSFAARVFERILQTHTCVHIHPNNCCGSLRIRGLDIPRIMEFTFFRNDRVMNPSYQKVFPNLLDYDNTDNPSLILPKCWHFEE